ncbi:MAG: LPS assembly lipoprotein LptE [Pseudomonadota bacterium]
MWSRRSIFAAGAALALPGCGFRPLYAARGDGGPEIARELSAVRVARVPERNGQILRRALEERFATTGTQGRYDLRVGVVFAAEIEGYRRDGTPSRVRYVATAPWSLYTMATPPVLLSNGTERTFDAYGLPENQFFAADNSRDAMERRLVEQLAEDVARRLSIYFATRPPA